MSDKKKDLTQLTDLPPMEQAAIDENLSPSPPEDPFAGLEPFSFESAMAGLPPVDAEILKSANDNLDQPMTPEAPGDFPTTDFGTENLPTTEEKSNAVDDPMFPISSSDQVSGSASDFSNSNHPSFVQEDFSSLGSSSDEQEERPLEQSAAYPPLAQDVPSARAPTSDGHSGFILAPPTQVPTPSPKIETPAPAVNAIKQSMDKIKNYSDRVSPSASTVPAGIPYSLVIEGELKVHEKERLLEIISREQLGVREVEIEPQLAAGKILIPRISEYAGVLIAQALRNSNTTLRLGPTDKIFQSKELAQDDDSLILPRAPNYVRNIENHIHASDELMLTSSSEITGYSIGKIIDTFEVSINLRALHVHSQNSTFFQESLESVKKQLRLRAHHKGADALVRFKTELFPLDDQSQYKLIATAVAVKLKPHA
ncbi:MAG: hypothetical protein EOP09_01680 [Proteobacteria bacterium]|nr:MAG: hypothetical protein EOP09_01680 [Pseudomonadota bacterium]